MCRCYAKFIKLVPSSCICLLSVWRLIPVTGVIRKMVCTRKDKESIYMHLQSFTDDANGLTLPRKI